MKIRNFSGEGGGEGGVGVQYFVLCQNQRQHKTRERSNYSTLSRRFESIYSAMKLLAPGLMQILTTYAINCMLIIIANM